MELVDETRLRLTTAENDILAAEADVALARAKKRLAEVAFEKDKRQEETAGIAAPRPPIPNLTESELARDVANCELTSAKAKLAKASANLDFRREQLARIRQLHDQGAVEMRLVNEMEAQLKAGEAGRAAAEAGVAVAQSRLKSAEDILHRLKSDEGSKSESPSPP